MENLNAKLYSNEILEDWQNRKHLIEAEKHLISKYLLNKSNSILEAGTGGGRISFELEELGFNNIQAFDYIPEMIDHAKKRVIETKSSIQFDVLDATNLTKYEDNSFDYAIYLQQVLCFISDENAFKNALKESYRVTKPKGLVIYSFLDMDSRPYNGTLSFIVNFLRLLRGEKRQKQHLPWLKINNKFNYKLLFKNQPTNYWVKKEDILLELEKIGFEIIEANNTNQLFNKTSDRKGMLYVVCQK
jgi:ubiquinone/menaquinone biosynthesis C-methylase UbiE